MDVSFRSWLSGNTAARRFALTGILLCIAYYILEYVNGRSQMADFRVYYDAATAFRDHTQLYGKAFGVGSGFYKYSPFASIPFIPFSWLRYDVASLLYYLLLSVAIIFFSLWLAYFLRKGEGKFRRTGVLLVLVSIYMADHLERELHLGNINLYLLMAAIPVFLSKEQKPVKAAGIYAVMILFKPHFLVLLPYFIWKKNFKMTLLTCLFAVVGLLVPVMFYGWGGNLQLHTEWLTAIRDHNVELFESPNTLYGIFNKFVLAGNGGPWLVWICLAVVAALFVWFMTSNRVNHHADAPFIEFFCLIALIPNLAHTDTEHFMWTWPLIAYTIYQLLNYRLQGKIVLIVAMMLAFIPYCLNSPDLVGRDLRYLFDEGGLLGIANFLIICVSVIVFRQVRKIQALGL